MGHGQVIFSDFFREIVVRPDTSEFTWMDNSIYIQGKRHLYFYYEQESPVCEIRLFPSTSRQIRDIEVLKSDDFELIEDLVRLVDNQFKFKIKFKSLTKSSFLNFTFKIDYFGLGAEQSTFYEVPMLPCTITQAVILPKSDELFVGEEQTFEIFSNQPENIKLQNQWTTGLNIDYRVTKRQNRIYLHLLPNKLGNQEVNARLNLFNPYMDELKKLHYQLPPVTHTFKVKPARLAFLKISENDVILSEKTRNEGVEIELNYVYGLRIGKTYRLEGIEQAGGALMAEIFTRKLLSNEKVLCWLRVYNYHRKEEGYLYIKDGDTPVFLTNFDISPQTQIEKMSVLHEGQDWNTNRNVHPGEYIEIKIEGKALQRTSFQFDGLTEVKQDTARRSETAIVYSGRVPSNITKKQFRIYNRNENTNLSLQVREFQNPHEFDFIKLKVNDKEEYTLSEVGNQIITRHTVKDIIFYFDEEKIDGLQNFFGTQYLSIEVRVNDPKNRLLDNRTTQLQICPGVSSPRYNFYERKNCHEKTYSLNELLRAKVYDLEPWSTIELTIQHQAEKYGNEGFKKKINIILRSELDFDIDVSFPAGLVIKRLEDEGFGNLGGISMAVIAQFGFFNKNKINRLRPYKFGAGFLALNAFNFSQNSSGRDVGIVALASIHPLQRFEKRKLSLRIYLGGGYFLSEEKWFLLFGPGIRVQL